jgi:hypothetical protein
MRSLGITRFGRRHGPVARHTCVFDDVYDDYDDDGGDDDDGGGDDDEDDDGDDDNTRRTAHQ